MFPKTVSYEDNVFVFRVNGNSETTTVLPGLEESDRFKARIWRTKIGKYEIIS